MSDVRILGRFGVAANVEALSLTESERRWLLCSRDFVRQPPFNSPHVMGGGVLLLAETNAVGASILGGYPATNVLDGNRQSFMMTSRNCEWVRLTLDTGVSDRKALLFLDYFEGEEVEPFEVEFTNENPLGASVTWHSVYSGMEAIYRFPRCGLWKLPWDTAIAQGTKTITVTGDVEFTVTPGDSSKWKGAMCIPQSGPNAGVPREIKNWDGGAGALKVDYPWRFANDVGVQFLFKDFAPNYLGSRYVRVKLRSRWHPTTGPIQCVGMSLFDYHLELKGDKSNFRAFRPPNPSRIGRQSNPLGFVHGPLLNGLVRFEQRFGPKRVVEAAWSCSYDGFADFAESWAGGGMIGIVDECGRYYQGYISGLDWDVLEKAREVDGGEVGLKFTFREV